MKKIFETDRLYLREMFQGDYNDLAEMLLDQEVVMHMSINSVRMAE